MLSRVIWLQGREDEDEETELYVHFGDGIHVGLYVHV